jgi:hypothetical protein
MNCEVITFWNWVERISWIASIILGIGAIALTFYLGRQETRIQNFNDLLIKNNKIIELLTEQNAEDLRLRNLQRKSNRTQLALTRSELFQQSILRGAIKNFDKLSIEAQLKWIKIVAEHLDQELYNPYLLENEELFKKWMTVHGNYTNVSFTNSIELKEGSEAKRNELEGEIANFYKAYLELEKALDDHFDSLSK